MDYNDALKAFALCCDDTREEALSVLASTPQGQGYLRLTSTMFKEVLQSAIEDKVSIDELEFWATILLQRDDYDVGDLEGSLYALSEPELMGGLDKAKIARLLTLLD